MKLAFYKGDGTFFDTLIKLWTGGDYSHCELIFSDGINFSADPRHPGVRYKKIEVDARKWDYVDLWMDSFDENKVRRWCNDQVGKKYDWLGIMLSQIFSFGVEDPNRYFCSEICVAAIQKANRLKQLNPSEISPVRLAEIYSIV